MLQPMAPSAGGRAPRIVVTLAVAARDNDPVLAARKNALYVDAVTRHGATAIPLDATAPESVRAGAFASMEGLLLSGGSDLEPARYGRDVAGSSGMDPERDALEAAAFAAADARGLPVLGICRGLQALNVFMGGTLTQHVDGHGGVAWGRGEPRTHPPRLVPGSRLARILSPTNAGGSVVTVNSYHHQAIRLADLAPGLVAAGLSPSPDGDLVEAAEAASGPFRVGVQCHPERTESTPRSFERLFAFFVDACRGPAGSR
jgi:putative glutamine amidotransferase